MTEQEPRWLSEDEQQMWRASLGVLNLLPLFLERELQQLHGLSLHDYEILVRLSEAPDRRLRLTELAGLSNQSKSRLSHQMTRMENAGLVVRESCAADRRGQWAVLTDAGWERLVKAAPDHVDGVRRHYVDLLTEEQKVVLREAFTVVMQHLHNADGGQTCPSVAGKPTAKAAGQAV
ncbi:MarR family winged helix-turn-helix transcriptional regulator [Yinghuangia soli]|uniref:MarR family winged helix-turn-helix transcriptional regulator n=1 Tax=Yinghuangia soli TaxID=2908204 RepID=A0AA41TZD1_9ACTN|nr:MarR family winged helix-turn-helix transcriptional regulator [Yinghuangia soli]MCF2528703.1 MarR family winged helix-turn-helix transcriptional regulator [Yinghuangia soli]MCF2531428.1 MarR family winged helix-turn-helix transcriptional regulator [Yinghuangia soli]